MHRHLSRKENQVGCVVELSRIVPLPANGNESLSRQTDILREQLGSAMRVVDQMAGAPEVRTLDQQISEKDVRALLKMRRNRDRFFGADMFADPAWDILLELYASALAQLRMSVTSLCAAAAVPPTTALRWINQLEEKGLIARKADPTDGRRHFLMLSKEGCEAMNAYFRTVPAGAPLI
jgi:DNA-binding MarR family transcriptional regulator